MSAYQFDYQAHLSELLPLIKELEGFSFVSNKDYFRLVKRFPRKDGGTFSKDQIIQAYRKLAGTNGLKKFDPKIVNKIKMKPVRSISGVTPLTVLTKPFPCPGQCIFCPNDVRMPKSYLSDEPGAQRAERNFFDPYLQTYNRLQALKNIGHPTDKIEILVLGGTWSFYPESYQIWFIKECFRALNEFDQTDGRGQVEARYENVADVLKQHHDYSPSNDPKLNDQQSKGYQINGAEFSKTYNQTISEMYVAPERKAGLDQLQTATWDELFEQQQQNESAACRCVGLVLETRPDNISEAEVIRLRKLGCTKTQIGVQSLNDDVLDKNKRGHNVNASREAFRLLRRAGLKIHAHWMANLYGSSVDKDQQDFLQLFSDPDFKPDELKIYPCSLIASAELMKYFKQGKWQPYTKDELLEVVAFALANTPQYCRLSRVIRDIPSTDIVEGNKLTNFRQIAQNHLQDQEVKLQDIRAREIRNAKVDRAKINYQPIKYQTSVSTEYFIEATFEDKLVGFLRLSLPKKPPFIDELNGSALIREIHVYGPAAKIGQKNKKAQHQGVGTKLIELAKDIAIGKYQQLSVISAIGTREYYRKKGFQDGELYQHLAL